jgi:histidinol-phosphatase (PHP family)
VFSYHNHTLWSDGRSALEKLIPAARSQGLQEVGISDHLVFDPLGRQLSWSMPLDGVATYVKEVQSCRQRAAEMGGPIVRLGLEADFFPETVTRTAQILRSFPFDYVIGSVHFLGDFAIDTDPALWTRLQPDEINQVWRRYWETIAEMADSRVFDIVGHIDLPKKFGFRPDTTPDHVIAKALDAIARAGMAIEINTSGWSLPAREAYPSQIILRMACQRSIPILISADAHTPAHLTRHFRRARLLAVRAGYRELVRFHERRPVSEPLLSSPPRL